MITGKLYDWLKWLAQVALPAAGTLYFTLSGIWGLPSANEVVGTIVATDLFLGVILGISQINYQKSVEDGGELIVQPDGKKVFSLNEGTVDNLHTKKEIRFKVKKAGSK